MGFGAVDAQAVQEHQPRSIVPPAHGTSTLPPHDPEHILAHHGAGHTEPLDSDDWLKRTNAHTQLSKAFTENQRHIFLNACGVPSVVPEATKKGTPDPTKQGILRPVWGAACFTHFFAKSTSAA